MIGWAYDYEKHTHHRLRLEDILSREADFTSGYVTFF